jgi:hypothetical protein
VQASSSFSPYDPAADRQPEGQRTQKEAPVCDSGALKFCHVFTGHAAHSCDPVAAVKNPSAHGEHLTSPSDLVKAPAAQGKQAAAKLTPVLLGPYVPVGHEKLQACVMGAGSTTWSVHKCVNVDKWARNDTAPRRTRSRGGDERMQGRASTCPGLLQPAHAPSVRLALPALRLISPRRTAGALRRVCGRPDGPLRTQLAADHAAACSERAQRAHRCQGGAALAERAGGARHAAVRRAGSAQRCGGAAGRARDGCARLPTARAPRASRALDAAIGGVHRPLPGRLGHSPAARGTRHGAARYHHASRRPLTRRAGHGGSKPARARRSGHAVRARCAAHVMLPRRAARLSGRRADRRARTERPRGARVRGTRAI